MAEHCVAEKLAGSCGVVDHVEERLGQVPRHAVGPPPLVALHRAVAAHGGRSPAAVHGVDVVGRPAPNLDRSLGCDGGEVARREPTPEVGPRQLEPSRPVELDRRRKQAGHHLATRAQVGELTDRDRGAPPSPSELGQHRHRRVGSHRNRPPAEPLAHRPDVRRGRHLVAGADRHQGTLRIETGRLVVRRGL
jgi:hypothetical protein